VVLSSGFSVLNISTCPVHSVPLLRGGCEAFLLVVEFILRNSCIIVSVHDIRESVEADPFILYVVTIWRRMFNFKSLPVYPVPSYRWVSGCCLQAHVWAMNVV
jgi:hypothetical protein